MLVSAKNRILFINPNSAQYRLVGPFTLLPIALPKTPLNSKSKSIAVCFCALLRDNYSLLRGVCFPTSNYPGCCQKIALIARVCPSVSLISLPLGTIGLFPSNSGLHDSALCGCLGRKNQVWGVTMRRDLTSPLNGLWGPREDLHLKEEGALRRRKRKS